MTEIKGTTRANTIQSQPWFEQKNLVTKLERLQNWIVIFLCIGLFFMMLMCLGKMFWILLYPINFQRFTSDILFVLILLELFHLLVTYLREQRISIGAAVEISLVSALREVIITGVLEIPLFKLLGVCCFLSILAVLLIVRTWISRCSNSLGGLPGSDQSVTIPVKPFSSDKKTKNIPGSLIELILPGTRPETSDGSLPGD